MNLDSLDIQLVEGESLPADLQSLIGEIAVGVAQTMDLTGTVVVQICDDAKMRDLNHQFRGHDAPTDVLAFATGPSQVKPDELPLGNIAISHAAATRQAKIHGHSMKREFGYLLVHALLHLAGMSHDVPENNKQMRLTEEQVLAKLGLTRAQPATTA